MMEWVDCSGGPGKEKQQCLQTSGGGKRAGFCQRGWSAGHSRVAVGKAKGSF